MYFLRRHPAYITLPFHDTYRRVRTNYKNIRYEHIYHVCTGFNTTNCGFWRNVKNNKRVPSGRTTFDYFIGKLMIEDIRKHDDGIYMTGDPKNSIGVFTVKGII
ncbi:unnamed protein product [Caenorhabditis brenneri]